MIIPRSSVRMKVLVWKMIAFLSTESAAPILVNPVGPKPEKRCPLTDRPHLVSRKNREQRDASSSEMARDVPGVFATAPTELVATPPSLHSMCIDPQVAEVLSADAMTESGHNSGLGIPGR